MRPLGRGGIGVVSDWPQWRAGASRHPRRHSGLIVAACLAACLAAPTAPLSSQPAAPTAPVVVELHIDAEIAPVMAEFVLRGLREAAAAGAGLALIDIDTPGGLSDSMRSIIQGILESPVPVAVYVAPAGARAASAGFFILEAADVAAMAPGTHAGAASPLPSIGGVPVSVDETLSKKILNDATAYMRSLAGRRGRNVTLAESAVTDGKAFTDAEALSGHLIDLVVPSRDDLLARLDGRTVARIDSAPVVLSLRQPRIVAVEMTARERFLSQFVQPNVFFVLLILGVLGLYAEFTHPGMILPGVVGGIALLLALYAMQLLPVSLTGLGLILLGMAMFILEAKVASHGVLGLGGAVAMLLGAVFLIRSPLTNAGVSLTVALGATIPAAAIAILLMRLVLRSRSWAPAVGNESLVGTSGEMVEAGGANGAAGLARVHGELWRVASSIALRRGDRVRVIAVNGLVLQVEPERAASGPPA